MRTAIAIPKSRENHFARAIYARALAHVTKHEPEAILKVLHPLDKKALAIVNKAASTVATTGANAWASQLMEEPFGEFLQTIAPQSAAAYLIGCGMRAQLPGSLPAKYPSRGAPTALAFFNEGAPLPVISRTLGNIDLGPGKSFGSATVASRELLKRSDAEGVLTTILAEDVSASLDQTYFSDNDGTGAAPKGLLYGLSPIEGAGGGDDVALMEDMKALTAEIAAGSSGEVVFIGSMARAMAFPLAFPQHSDKVQLLGSPAVADDALIAVDPRSLIHAYAEPEVDIGDAVANMEDATPEQIGTSGTLAAGATVSLWQADSIAIRIISGLAFAKRRAGAVAYVTEISW